MAVSWIELVAIAALVIAALAVMAGVFIWAGRR
jgi:hypothetical protein